MGRTQRLVMAFVAACVVAPHLALGSDEGGPALAPRAAWSKPGAIVITPAHDPGVIYVKFVDDLPIRLIDGLPSDHDGAIMRDAKARIDALRVARWERTHALADDALLAMRNAAERAHGKRLADMRVEFFAFARDAADTGAIIDALNALDIVEVALPMPRPTPPPLPPDFEPNQGYLDAAPTGVDADHVWTTEQSRGEGVAIADLEYFFDATHADLPPVTVVGVTPVDPGFGPNHGTAVGGELAAVNNGWGTTGIASGADIYFAGTYNGSSWNIAGELTAATNAMNPGDVILIEQQIGGPNGQFVPVEWFPPWYNAIVTAVGNGMVVVMAAGNGGQNLDDPMFSTGNGGHWPFLPENDSGAIIVGAGAAASGFGNSTTPRSRLSFSTFGSRVNLQGWGQSVWTTGYGGAYSAEGSSLFFTSTFSGTSSASPIVAGASALVQAVHKQRFSGEVLTSREMRALLMSTGAPQQNGANPASENIGPLPDVEAALIAMGFDEPCLGDSNGDGVVNFTDLSNTLSAFGRIGPGIPADFDGDEDVDFADLNVVLVNFGQSCR